MQQRRAPGRNSVFSEAQESVRILVRNEKASKIVGAKFWFYFRLGFPYLSSLLAVLLFVIPYSAGSNTAAFLFSGSTLSLFFCVCVLCSYVHIVPWRRHPSPLIFYRSFSHCFFSLFLMINSYSSYGPGTDQCKLLSVLIQFSYFTGECWLLTISVDLILSLTNPFSSYKKNLRRYHIVVWTSGAVISGVLLDSGCQDAFSDGICWIDASFECVLGFYLLWIVLFYAISICVVVFSAWRISRGLKSTYSTRKACVKDTFCIVAAYVIYSIFVFLLFILLTPQHNLQENSSISNSGKHIIAYFLALRGFVDAVLWFTLHDFGSTTSSTSSSNAIKPKTSSAAVWSNFFSSPLLEVDEERGDQRQSEISDAVDFASDTGTEGEFGIDVDLSPQLNMALRKEIVHFTTMGIIRSVELNMDTERMKTGEAVRVFPLEDESHVFTDFEPVAFRRLRILNNVEERWYQTQISQPAKERIAEGGSGAFLFFCGSGEFMVRLLQTISIFTRIHAVHLYPCC
jgi:1-phosphatidylinositol-4-phosphate 5-kinase